MMRLPEALLQSLEGLPGYDRAAFLQAHDEGREGATIRLNPHKWVQQGPGLSDRVAPFALSGDPSSGTNLRVMEKRVAERIPWCAAAFHISPRPAFVFDPLFHAGAYYVQEASSMLLSHAWRWVCGEEKAMRVLDLCAAPGGKTTLLAAQENISLLLSNEIIRNRVPVLYENVVKWGRPQNLVSSQDPRDFQAVPGFFDAMVVDAPCSGSGLFRKDPDAIGHWSIENVRHCSQRQQRILADALPSLRGDGYLFYATCSYSREENEDICNWLVREQGMTSIRLPMNDSWGVVESVMPEQGAYGYRCYPHHLGGEGFFLAVFRKTHGVAGALQTGRSALQRSLKPPPEMTAWVSDPERWHWIEQSGAWLAVPEPEREAWQVLTEAFRLRRSGMRVGSIAHGQVNPDHELAMSTVMAADLPLQDLSMGEALRYLKRELSDVETARRGWLLLRYQGVVLGLAKKLPNRINNYYPQEWRIRVALPEGIA